MILNTHGILMTLLNHFGKAETPDSDNFLMIYPLQFT